MTAKATPLGSEYVYICPDCGAERTDVENLDDGYLEQCPNCQSTVTPSRLLRMDQATKEKASAWRLERDQPRVITTEFARKEEIDLEVDLRAEVMAQTYRADSNAQAATELQRRLNAVLEAIWSGDNDMLTVMELREQLEAIDS